MSRKCSPAELRARFRLYGMRGFVAGTEKEGKMERPVRRLAQAVHTLPLWTVRRLSQVHWTCSRPAGAGASLCSFTRGRAPGLSLFSPQIVPSAHSGLDVMAEGQVLPRGRGFTFLSPARPICGWQPTRPSQPERALRSVRSAARRRSGRRCPREWAMTRRKHVWLSHDRSNRTHEQRHPNRLDCRRCGGCGRI